MTTILGADVPESEREAFLRDNCDGLEKKGYMRPFTSDELSQLKDNISTTALSIRDTEEQKKEASQEFDAILKPLRIQQKENLTNYRQKAEFVNEDCFQFNFPEERTVGFYNKAGQLVDSRPMTPAEMQQGFGFKGVYRNPATSQRTGTND